jgi:hypothetical protein
MLASMSKEAHIIELSYEFDFWAHIMLRDVLVNPKVRAKYFGY